MKGGDLIYQTSDQYSSIEVIDYQKKLRSLHFGNSTQQSAMLLNNPDVLIHKYTQAMVIPLCWLEVKNVCLLGLGSGSIAKFIIHNFPQLKIDAIELRSTVIELAISFFHLPEKNSGLNIINQCAREWLNTEQPTPLYELILVDMFLTTTKGEDKTISLNTQLERLTGKLSDTGIIVFNHLGNTTKNLQLVNDLQQYSPELHIYSLVIDSCNSVIFACRRPVPAKLDDKIHYDYERQTSSPCRMYFEKLSKH